MPALPVNIVASPSVPASGVYPVGTPLTLTCQAQGGNPPLTYNWTSSCGGLCFVLRETSDVVRQGALHSIDAGSHTCSATDYTGQTGNATLAISVTG